jgi:hypothetical protein
MDASAGTGAHSHLIEATEKITRAARPNYELIGNTVILNIFPATARLMLT